MRTFTCDACQQPVFFDNVRCTSCGHELGFVPELCDVTALEAVTPPTPSPAPQLAKAPAPVTSAPVTNPPVTNPPATNPPATNAAATNAPPDAPDTNAAATNTQIAADANAPLAAPAPEVISYRALHPRAGGALYRRCQNALDHGVCTWLVPIAEDRNYCRACRLNETIPDLSKPERVEGWASLERAKRRLMYSLLDLGLPIETREELPGRGLGFAFLQDQPDQKVFTGQSDGLITINIAEADDPFREKIRKQLRETYRTLLGHFRHEIGHYYWDRLIKDDPDRLQAFRALFGDETYDYDKALKEHYENGAPSDWPLRFVSTYASTHPWEDWAESWAHYLHIVDTVDTANCYGITMRNIAAKSKAAALLDLGQVHRDDFDVLIESWFPLTVALNSLNRSMGLPDTYPFVLSKAVVEKLRFVHDLIANHAVAAPSDQPKRDEPSQAEAGPASSQREEAAA